MQASGEVSGYVAEEDAAGGEPQSQSPPFNQKSDPDVFFPGGRREEICQSLINDLQGGARLLSLTGDSGSGKTLLCQLIAQKLGKGFVPLYLDGAAASFEHLLQQSAMALGTPRDAGGENFSWQEEFKRQLFLWQEKNCRVALLIDQAERLFAAALERLLRLNSAGDPPFAILLSGASALTRNLAQLAAQYGKKIPEKSYTLQPLDEDETEKYLRVRLRVAGIGWNEQDAMLTSKRLKQIFKKSRGNIALTNALAEELCADKLLLPGERQPRENEAGQRQEKRFVPAASQQSQDMPEKKEHACAKNSVQSVSAFCAPAGASPVYEQAMEEESIWFLALYDLLLGNRKLLAGLCCLALFLFCTGMILECGRKAAPFSDPGPKELDAFQQAPEKAAQHVQNIPEAAGQAAPLDGESLLQARMAAGTALVAASYRKASTIFLMNTSGNEAEAQLIKLLTEEVNPKEREQIYIIKKGTHPVGYFVFYGIFESAEQARQMRNNMSFELRAHHPYPLTITEALRLNEG